MEKIPTDNTKRESGCFEGKRYDVGRLYEFAESIPTEVVPIEEFNTVISPENESWTGTDGKIIGPYNIARDWESAQQNSIWSHHIESIKRVNLDVPILVSYSGHVIDGQHRVVRTFIEGKKDIKIKRLPRELPEDLQLSTSH